MTALVEAATRYAEHGWPVFPCRPGAKAPHTANGLKDASTDTGLIEGWWNVWPAANVAIVTGRPSGLVVLDVDGDDGAEALRTLERQHGRLPRTLSVVTPRGGNHYYFKHPGAEVRNSASQVGSGLDIRGDGGYVLVPPSVVGGRSYELDERAAPAPLPRWLLEAASSRAPVGQRTPTNEWVSMVRVGVRGPDASGGGSEGRNDKMTRLVGHLLRRYVDVALVLELANLVNHYRFRPPLAPTEVERIVDSIAGRELQRRQKAIAQAVNR